MAVSVSIEITSIGRFGRQNFTYCTADMHTASKKNFCFLVYLNIAVKLCLSANETKNHSPQTGGIGFPEILDMAQSSIL